jgi:hypothetical protein
MIPLFLGQWLRYCVFQVFRLFVIPKARLAGCPNCGKSLPAIKISPTHLWDTRIDCPHCDHWMAILELEPSGSTNAALLAASLETVGDQKPMPVGCQIEVVDRAGTRMWRLPAKGGLNFLTGFGLLWLTFSSMFLALTLFADGPRGTEVNLLLFAFVFVGLVLAFLGFKISHTENWLLLNDETLIHESRWLWSAKRRTFEREALTDVSLVVAYEQNDQPVHTIQLAGREGKARFGVALSVAEKAWLLIDLRRTLQWNDRIPAAKADGTALPMGDFQAGGLKVSILPNRCEMELSTPKTAAPWLFGGGFSALMLGFMLLTGPSFIPSSPSPLGNAFHLGFALVWYGPLGIGFMGGVFALWTGSGLLRLRRKIIASRDGLRLQWQQGTQHGEWFWRSDQIAGIEVRGAGHTSSSHSTYRVGVALPDFIGALGEAQTVAELAPVVGALNVALGRTNPPPYSAEQEV